MVQGTRIPVVGGVSDGATAAAEYRADSVDRRRPAQGRRPGDPPVELGPRGHRHGARPDIAARRCRRAPHSLRPVEGLPLLHVEIPTFDGWRHVLKRTFDIAFARHRAGAARAAASRSSRSSCSTDGGPVFFRQDRCGRDGDDLPDVQVPLDGADRRGGSRQPARPGRGRRGALQDAQRPARDTGRPSAAQALARRAAAVLERARRRHELVGPRPPLAREVEAYEGDVQSPARASSPGSPASGRSAAAPTSAGRRACGSTSTTSRTGRSPATS